MVTIGLVVAMGILPMSAHSNMASAQEQEQTGTLVMTKEDEIDSFDDLAGMTLDLSDKNIVPDDSGKVEIDVNDAVQQGNMARNMIKGNLSFVIEGFNFKKMNLNEKSLKKNFCDEENKEERSDHLSVSLFGH